MPIDINFGALQPANPFAAYAQGQEIGQQNRQRQARQAAGNVFSTDPDKAAGILMGAGDYEGGVAIRKLGREDRMDKARTSAVAKLNAGDTKGAQTEALGAGDVELAASIAKMDKEQRDQAKANAEQLAAVGVGLSQRPYEERKALIQQLKPGLVQHGIDPAAIDAFDPTDANIQAFSSQALGVKGLLEQADKDRNFGLKEDQFGESRRHNKATEDNSAGQLAVSRGQLGVARDNLGMRGAEFQQRAALAGAGGGKPMTAAAQNLQATHLDMLQTTSGINGRLQNVVKQLDTGALKLGPVSNVFSTARNAVGQSDQASRNYASFKANLEKLRNDSLRLNKGVQTEGDAQRAWNELVSNINDPAVVKQRLQEIEGYNRQALAYHADVVSQIRQDSRQPAIDTGKFLAQPQAQQPAASPASDGTRRPSNRPAHKMTDAEIKAALGL